MLNPLQEQLKIKNKNKNKILRQKLDAQFEETKEDEYRNKDYEDGVSVANIKMVMEYTKCERQDAINALKQFDDDPVEAIMSFVK